VTDPLSSLRRGARWFAIAVLAVLTWRFARMPLDGSDAGGFLHLPNLIFHEAGHFIFMPFGRFISVLGGSLLQVLIPLICAGAFLWQERNRFAAAVCVWWAGQNFVDLAPYISDARRLQLPLLGGATGAEVEGHDWEYLLTALGWTHHDITLGRSAQLVGVLVMLGATLWCILLVGGAAETDAVGERSRLD
jgi:hypothetical protein